MIGRAVCVALALGVLVRAQSAMTTPAAHFGFELAADGKFAMWDQEVAYYEKLAKESDRIDLQVLGKSTQGRPFLMLTISSPQNLAKLDRYQGNLQADGRPARPDAAADRRAGGRRPGGRARDARPAFHRSLFVTDGAADGVPVGDGQRRSDSRRFSTTRSSCSFRASTRTATTTSVNG